MCIFSPALQGAELHFMAFRLSRDGSHVSCKNSLILKLKMPQFGKPIKDVLFNKKGPSWFGWERNLKGNLGPKFANMKNTIDPIW